MKSRAYLLMLFVSAIWGSTFVVIKGALSDATPVAFNLARMILAFILLGAFYFRAWRQVNRWHVLFGALAGLSLAIGYQAQTQGLSYTTPSKSAFITGMMVVIVPLLSLIPGIRPPDMNRPTWNAFLGAMLALVGILLLTLPATHSTSSHAGFASDFLASFSSVNIGDVLSLGCAFGFAGYCLVLGHAAQKCTFQPLALMQIGFCALFIGISLPLFEHPHIQWTWKLWSALLIVAVLATAVALSVQSWAQSILPSTHVALILALEPVFAWVTSYFVTGEKLGIRPTIGASFILVGILITELIKPHKHKENALQTA